MGLRIITCVTKGYLLSTKGYLLSTKGYLATEGVFFQGDSELRLFFFFPPTSKEYRAPLFFRFIVSAKFSLSVENEQAGEGRDGRTRLARKKIIGANTGTGKMKFSLFS